MQWLGPFFVIGFLTAVVTAAAAAAQVKVEYWRVILSFRSSSSRNRNDWPVHRGFDNKLPSTIGFLFLLCFYYHSSSLSNWTDSNPFSNWNFQKIPNNFVVQIKLELIHNSNNNLTRTSKLFFYLLKNCSLYVHA